MDESVPSAFYTGIVSELYGPLRSSVPDPEPYAAFVARYGQPALELGCGAGDPLLDLRTRGFDVEGLDSSNDMLERLRLAATDRRIEVIVHHSTIENMDLGRRYRSIFLAGPTFNLLPDDAAAQRALERIRAHLEANGAALIPLFVPNPTSADAFGVPREHRTASGRLMRLTCVREERDDRARLQTTTLRYELRDTTGVQTIERPWVLHWHSQDGFRRLAAEAGLRTSAILSEAGTAAKPDDATFAFVLQPADG